MNKKAFAIIFLMWTIGFLIVGGLLVSYYFEDWDFDYNKTITNKSGFCGTSTFYECEQDSDCTSGGCSGQICQGVDEEKQVSICNYKECYDDEVFNVVCGCVENKCQWG